MDFETTKLYLMAMIIAIPAIIGLINIKKINTIYWPIIFICVLALINENISLFQRLNNRINFTASNIYFLINSLLFLILFHNWNLFIKSKKLFQVLFILLVVFWSIDNFYFSLINKYPIFYRLFFANLVVVLATININKLIYSVKGNLLANPQFLICVAIIIFYTMRILSFSFSLLKLSMPFQTAVSDIGKYSATIYNILILIAVLCLPKKKTSLIPY